MRPGLQGESGTVWRTKSASCAVMTGLPDRHAGARVQKRAARPLLPSPAQRVCFFIMASRDEPGHDGAGRGAFSTTVEARR